MFLISVIIIITVTSDILAKTKIAMPESLPGEAVISVTSEDGNQQKTYEVEFVNEDGALVGQ